jgi:hypothetical protein
MKTIAAILMMTMFMGAANAQDVLTGSWSMNKGGVEVVWIFADGYNVQAFFDKESKRFFSTSGGPYQIQGDELIMQTEFETIDSLMVGTPASTKFTVNGDKLMLEGSMTFTRIDNGTAPLAGNWRITGRMQNGQMVEGPLGARKTLKILSGTRFQWIAINPEVKGFYGTGGGTYTFINGKYTENIEFFSRDSTRVGASLTFDGKVEDGAWYHSGLNSRGEPLNEIWRRVNRKL